MSLVRPEAPGTLNEISDEEDEPEYQDRAYRNAWESFDPDKEGQKEDEEIQEEGQKKEGVEDDWDKRGHPRKRVESACGTISKGSGKAQHDTLAIQRLVRALCAREGQINRAQEEEVRV